MGRRSFAKPNFSLFLGLFLVLHPSFCPPCPAFFPYRTPRASGSPLSQQVLLGSRSERVPRSAAAAPRLALTKQPLPRSRPGAPACPRAAPAGPRAARLAGIQPAAGEPWHPAPKRANGRGLNRGKEISSKARVGADSKSSPDRGKAPGAAPFDRCKQKKAAFNYNVHKRRRQAPSSWITRVRITRDEVKALQTLPVKRELSFSTRCKWEEKQLQSSTINCFIQASASSGRHAFECHPHKTPPSQPVQATSVGDNQV